MKTMMKEWKELDVEISKRSTQTVSWGHSFFTRKYEDILTKIKDDLGLCYNQGIFKSWTREEKDEHHYNIDAITYAIVCKTENESYLLLLKYDGDHRFYHTKILSIYKFPKNTVWKKRKSKRLYWYKIMTWYNTNNPEIKNIYNLLISKFTDPAIYI
jgi:hypothetical protein